MIVFSTGRHTDADKYHLLVTDGQSNVQKHLTIPNAKILKNNGLDISVIAVGDYIIGIEEMIKVVSFRRRITCTEWRISQVIGLVVKEVSPGKYAIDKNKFNFSCKGGNSSYKLEKLWFFALRVLFLFVCIFFLLGFLLFFCLFFCVWVGPDLEDSAKSLSQGN